MNLPALGLTLAIVWAVPSAIAHAAPPVVPPSDPIPIIDGTVVPECAWPSVVALFSESGGRCTGFYIGGRVILTAAHCMLPWFQVDAIDGTETCATVADCPTEDAFGEPLALECPPGVNVCRDPDPTKSSDVTVALFGERYRAPNDDEHIRRSVEIDYCRRRDATRIRVALDAGSCSLVSPPSSCSAHRVGHGVGDFDS